MSKPDAQTPRPVQPSITCPRCGMTTYNPTDIKVGYCGNCRDYTSPPKVDPPEADVPAA